MDSEIAIANSIHYNKFRKSFESIKKWWVLHGLSFNAYMFSLTYNTTLKKEIKTTCKTKIIKCIKHHNPFLWNCNVTMLKRTKSNQTLLFIKLLSFNSSSLACFSFINSTSFFNSRILSRRLHISAPILFFFETLAMSENIKMHVNMHRISLCLS